MTPPSRNTIHTPLWNKKSLGKEKLSIWNKSSSGSDFSFLHLDLKDKEKKSTSDQLILSGIKLNNKSQKEIIFCSVLNKLAIE